VQRWRINAWLTDPHLRRDPCNAARLLEAARDGLDSLAVIRRGCAAAAEAVGGAGVLGILAAAQAENLRGHDAKFVQSHKAAQRDRMRLHTPLCPECGEPANGTLERLTGRADFDGVPGTDTDVGHGGWTDVGRPAHRPRAGRRAEGSGQQADGLLRERPRMADRH